VFLKLKLKPNIFWETKKHKKSQYELLVNLDGGVKKEMKDLFFQSECYYFAVLKLGVK